MDIAQDNYQANSSGIFLPKNYTIFNKPNAYEITNRRLDELRTWSELIQWGRRNPCLFAEHIFGVEFMDYQKYVFMMSWNTPYVVWCMGRGSGKSILGSILIMTKTLLIPDHVTYILCGVGSQSIELFTKIEKFVNNQIPSFDTLTDVYQSELQKSANSNGFVHNPASYTYRLYNNSQVYTLNGSFDNNRSKRSNLNFYDEAAFVGNEELFTTSEPFCTQNAKFKLGVGQDENYRKSNPEPFSNQLIYASSAGRTDQYFFKKYREASLHMDAGDKRYFCADISSDVVINATLRGVALSEALLTQETIDSRMREDKEAGLREYKNIFTSEGGEGQIIKRSDIIRNSYPRLPVLFNETGDKMYGFAYDPARQADNSVVAIAEYFKDPDFGWKMRMVNLVRFADIFKKNKTPINTPAQIRELKKLLLAYNGEGNADYENIMCLLVDAGSGGAGVPITDFLCEDWKDEDDVTHRGLIDPEYNEGDGRKYPNAVKDKLRLMNPSKYKSEIFEATIKMMELNLIEFTEEYNNKGYLNLLYEVDAKGNKTQIFKYPSEKEEKALLKRGVTIETSQVSLDVDQELALKELDMMKTEVVNIYRFEQANGKDRFDLAPDKSGKLNDDRAYVFALLGWQLAQLRREKVTKKTKPKKTDIASRMMVTKPKVHGSVGKMIG